MASNVFERVENLLQNGIYFVRNYVPKLEFMQTKSDFYEKDLAT